MNKTTIGVFVIASVVLLAVGSVAAFGIGHDFGLSEEDQAERQAFMGQVQTAVENGDYETWHSLMQSQITEERFAQLQENHEKTQEMKQLREQLREAIQNGDIETAEELKSQMQNLMPEDFSGKVFGKGFRMGKTFGGGNCSFAQAE